MNRSGRWRLLYSSCVCILLGAHSITPNAAAPQVLRAKVIAYGSGTAFAVLDEQEKLKRVKLAGVDAPEATQRFGPQARQLAGEWLGVGTIDVAIDKVDKDGRVYGRVSVDGRDVGLELIKAGMAWCDPADAKDIPAAVRDRYDAECAEAKKNRRGLWIDANPNPPWEQRKIPQFAPTPGAERPPGRSCQEIGYQTVQCDDGKTYRSVGGQVYGSDGTVYSRRGNTVTDDSGNRFEQRGTSIYGSDGTVCRTRGKRIDCY
jgi:endonuclease YncB( thermonuclease family)